MGATRTCSRRGGIKLAWATAIAVCLVLVSAAPAPAAGTLRVGVAGVGHVGGEGIDCGRALGGTPGPDCGEFVPDMQICIPTRKPPCSTSSGTIFLTAADTVGSGFTFDHWSLTSCTSRQCAVPMPANRTVTATFRDSQAPTVSLAEPAAGAVRGVVPLAASASDNAGVARVEFRFGSATVATASAAPYRASADTRALADGTFAVTAVAVDTAGLSAASAARSVTIDNTAPALAVTGPDGSTFGPGSTQAWSIGASDATTAVTSVACSVVPAGRPPSFGACSGGATGHTVAGVAGGAYELRVRAVDGVGNAAERTKRFTIDATPPDVTITAGTANGATTTATAQTWRFVVDDPGAAIACRVHPAALTPGPFGACTGPASHTASGFAPGTYTFEVRATDAVGNVDPTPAARTFTVAAPSTAQGGTGAPGGGAARRISVRLAYAYRLGARSTELVKLQVKDVPRRATVKATCRGRCPRRSLIRRGVTGVVRLTPFVGAALAPGTRIRIVVSKAGRTGAVKILTIRARKGPKVVTKCLPEGARSPRACRAT